MKLISPWRWRVTSLRLWRATAGKPIFVNRSRRSCGSGAVYSTNSNPSVPIGFSRPSGPFSATAVAMFLSLLPTLCAEGGAISRRWVAEGAHERCGYETAMDRSEHDRHRKAAMNRTMISAAYYYPDEVGIG